MADPRKIRVGVNGFGVIGKRVAAAVARQEDMSLAGVSDVVTDWRASTALRNGFRLFGATADSAAAMRAAGLDVTGTLDELLGQADVVVDCTPKRIAAKNIDIYRHRGLKFIVQGGEKHDATGHSFVAEANYATALDREATRVVSCNTTSIVRTLSSLKRAGLLQRARGTRLRRATDPWESHESGIMNTLVPEPEISSHQGPDAQSVDPDLDVVTMAVKVPETLAHLHYWSVQMTRRASKDEVLDAFRTSSRIALIDTSDGLVALNTVKEALVLAFDVLPGPFSPRRSSGPGSTARTCRSDCSPTPRHAGPSATAPSDTRSQRFFRSCACRRFTRWSAPSRRDMRTRGAGTATRAPPAPWGSTAPTRR